MMKHIARHNDKKVVVVFRKIPGDDHLALCVYADNIPSQMHDDIMKVLEGPVGQQEHEFANALHRSVLTDGRNALAALHSEGYLKKVPTNQVIMTPTSTSTVRLDELNKIVDEISIGDEARSKLAENDAARGIVDPTATRAQASTTEALSDEDIAADMLRQAEQMEANAKSMIAEAERLVKEANNLLPKAKTKKASTSRASTAKKAAAKKATA